MRLLFFFICSLTVLASCGDGKKTGANTAIVDNKHAVVNDPHSASNHNSVKAKHLDWQIRLDFATKTMYGLATWTINNLTGDSVLILDTDELLIDSVFIDGNIKTNYTLQKAQPYVGTPLVINIKPTTSKVSIHYRVLEHAGDTMAALQWLSPEQTFGKVHPYLFTKSEPHLSRCWIPCQDAPANKVTYNATVQAPKDLMVLMSAQNPTQKSADGVYKFEMKEPIPTYLIAMAVGDIAFKPIDNRTGVYAEPSLIDKAHYEFGEVPQMLQVAEDLYGKYDFGRYDILVLPLAFPIGGMENPRLTFSTPTILAGDRSLVNLIAHELAHSWAGNLVTNATWDDLWLNEGFTVYYERRIMEALRGKDYAEMLWELGGQDLNLTIKDYGKDTQFTSLKLHLAGLDPDISLSDVAYEKGALFLRMLEEKVGRKDFDPFVKSYFAAHRFKSITTEDFVAFLEKNLLSKNKEWQENINYKEWIYQAGVPKNAPVPTRKKFSAVESQFASFQSNKDVQALQTQDWSTHEWLHFLRKIPDNMEASAFANLDSKYSLTGNKNAEIAAIWYEKAIKAKYTPAYEAMKQFLSVTGRQKFLRPIYTAMVSSGQGSLAKDIFNKSKQNYHPIAQGNMQKIIAGGG